jgi:hypothetical protein
MNTIGEDAGHGGHQIRKLPSRVRARDALIQKTCPLCPDHGLPRQKMGPPKSLRHGHFALVGHLTFNELSKSEGERT